MNELEMLQRMLDREGGIYEVETGEEFNEDTGEYDEITFLCIPAIEEFLILCFDKEGNLCFIDAEADWEDYLKRKRGE